MPGEGWGRRRELGKPAWLARVQRAQRKGEESSIGILVERVISLIKRNRNAPVGILDF